MALAGTLCRNDVAGTAQGVASARARTRDASFFMGCFLDTVRA